MCESWLIAGRCGHPVLEESYKCGKGCKTYKAMGLMSRRKRKIDVLCHSCEKRRRKKKEKEEKERLKEEEKAQKAAQHRARRKLV